MTEAERQPASFEQALAEVRHLLSLSDEEVEQLVHDVKRLASETLISPEQALKTKVSSDVRERQA